MESQLPVILGKYGQQLLEEWMQEQNHAITRRSDLLSDAQLRKESGQFLELLKTAFATGQFEDIAQNGWQDMREFLDRLSYARAEKGFNPTETALFVFSFKQPLVSVLRKELLSNPAVLADETWRTNAVLDQLGLYTTEVYQKSRNEIIKRQQREILELSTPVVRLWS